MKKLAQVVRRLQGRRDEGATAVEYGLLVAFVAIILAAGAFMLGNMLNNTLQQSCFELERSGRAEASCGDFAPDDGGDDGGDEGGDEGGFEE